jgi:spore coat protein U-like protein
VRAPFPRDAHRFQNGLHQAARRAANASRRHIMQLSRIGAISAAAAIAFGALISTTAPIASAEKINEKTIKSECKSAGGTYTSTVKGGTRFSTCDYKDNEGNGFRDYYNNGEYYSTRPM